MNKPKSYRWNLTFQDPDDPHLHKLDVKSRGNFSEIDMRGKLVYIIWVLEAFKEQNLEIRNWHTVGEYLIIEHTRHLTSGQ